MPNYNWKCQVCETINEAENTICKKCSCPAECTAEDIERWDKHTGLRKPTKPSIYNNTQGPLAKVDNCPQCGLLMLIKDTKCPHCGHLLSNEETIILQEKFYQTRKKGIIWGVIVILILFFLLYFIFKNTT